MNKKAFKNSSSSRSVFMRDIKSFLLRPYPALQACGVTRPEGVRGFTLIELLVVVLIIGILAAVALPQYEKAVEKSRMAEAVQVVSSLQKAVDIYVMTNGYPSDGIIRFVADEPDVALDIDVTSNLNCPEGDTECYSKYFQYGAHCQNYLGGAVCSVDAVRCNNEACNDAGKYALSTSSQAVGNWRNYCLYHPSLYTQGESLCKSLESLGYESEEDE